MPTIFDIDSENGTKTVKNLLEIQEALNLTYEVTGKMVKDGGFARAFGGGDKQAAVDTLKSIREQQQAVYSELVRMKGVLANSTMPEDYAEVSAEVVKLAEQLERAVQAEQDLQSGAPDEGFGEKFSPQAFSGSAQQLFSSFGGGGGEGPFAGIGEGITQITDFTEQVGTFSEQAKLGAKQLTGFLTNFAPIGSGFAGIFSGLKAGVATTVAAMGPWAIAAGAAAAGVALLSAKLDAERKARERLREATQDQIDDLRELSDLISQGTTEDILAEREKLTASYEDEINYLQKLGTVSSVYNNSSTQERERFLNFIEDFDNTYAAANGTLQDWLNSTDDLLAIDFRERFGVNDLNDALDAINQFGTGKIDLDTLNQTIIDTADASDKLQGEMRQLTAALDDDQVARNDARAAQREATQRLKDAEDELTQVRLDAADSAAAFEDSLKSLTDQYDQDKLDTEEQRRRADELSLRDHNRELERMESEHKDAMITLKEEQNDEIERLQDDFKQSQIDAQKDLDKSIQDIREGLGESLADLDVELAENRATTIQNYMEQEIETLADHQDELLKAEEDYQKERKRRLEDLQDELLQAEAANDVVAFLNAQRQGKKDLDRMAEDYEDQRTESQAAFDQGMADRAQQFEEELATMQQEGEDRRNELQTQAAEQIADLREQFAEAQAERQAQYEQQLEDLRVSHAEARQEAITAYKDQREDTIAAFKQRRIDEQEQRDYEDNQRREAFDRQLADLDKQHQAEIAAQQTREDKLLAIIESGGTLQEEAVNYTQLQVVSAYKTGAAQAVDAIRQQMAALESAPSFWGASRTAQSGGTAPLFSGGTGSNAAPIFPSTSGAGASPVASGGGVLLQFNAPISLGGITQGQFEEGMTNLGTIVIQGMRDARVGVRTPLA